VVTPGYFRTAGIPLRAGRALSANDARGAPAAAVISEALARALWPGEDPLGRRLATDRMGEGAWYTVVGVVGDIRHARLDVAPRPMVYRTMAQARGGFFMDWGMDLVVRATGEPLALASAVRQAIAAERPELPAFELAPMRAVIGLELADRRFVTVLLGIFAALALLLAAVGIYGVVAYSVNLRAHEIGVRMALGEGRAEAVVRMTRSGMMPVALGLAVGLAAAAALSGLLAHQLYGVTAIDPSTYALAAGLLATVALVACLLPARRAARVDPANAFRGG
jgi:putative ABC transport system permease protein